MNLEFEVCRKCKVKCLLEKRSSEIVSNANQGVLKTEMQVRDRVSSMCSEGNSIRCPKSEITLIRKKTFEQIPRRFSRIENGFVQRSNVHLFKAKEK